MAAAAAASVVGGSVPVPASTRHASRKALLTKAQSVVLGTLLLAALGAVVLTMVATTSGSVVHQVLTQRRMQVRPPETEAETQTQTQTADRKHFRKQNASKSKVRIEEPYGYHYLRDDSSKPNAFLSDAAFYEYKLPRAFLVVSQHSEELSPEQAAALQYKAGLRQKPKDDSSSGSSNGNGNGNGNMDNANANASGNAVPTRNVFLDEPYRDKSVDRWFKRSHRLLNTALAMGILSLAGLVVAVGKLSQSPSLSLSAWRVALSVLAGLMCCCYGRNNKNSSNKSSNCIGMRKDSYHLRRKNDDGDDDHGNPSDDPEEPLSPDARSEAPTLSPGRIAASVSLVGTVQIATMVAAALNTSAALRKLRKARTADGGKFCPSAPVCASAAIAADATPSSDNDIDIDIDACIEGCLLGPGGKAAVVAIGLWIVCCALVVILAIATVLVATTTSSTTTTSTSTSTSTSTTTPNQQGRRKQQRGWLRYAHRVCVPLALSRDQMEALVPARAVAALQSRRRHRS